MTNIDIFSHIKDTFCDLWKYKVRGETMEIITAFTTPNSKFISVFITKRNDNYIITDGGWLLNGEYSDTGFLNDKNFKSLLKYFESYYRLKTVDHYGTKMFYKTTDRIEMIPNKVHDVAQFVSQSIMAYLSTYENQEEGKELENFRTDVDNFINGIVDKSKLFVNKSLGEGYDGVRFNMIVTHGNSMSLVKYVTGTSFYYYKRSLNSATADFEIANRSEFNSVIKNKIAVVNDLASGYERNKVIPYIGLLETHIGHPVSLWSQKGNLPRLLD